MSDSFSLSALAQEFFTQLESAYTELFEDYPQYKKYFEGPAMAEKNKGLSLLGQTREFLGRYRALSEKDGDFKQFYQHIEELSHYAEEAFRHTQKTSTKTLKKIYGRE